MEMQTLGTIAGTVLATLTVARLLAGGSWNLSGRITTIENSIQGVQNEMKRLADVLVSIADVKGELRVLATRITATEQDVRELRHGEGMVLPLKSPFEKP